MSLFWNLVWILTVLESCRLGKLIVTTYVTRMVTHAISVWGYLGKTHKQKLQSLLDRALRWACEAHYLTSNKIIWHFLHVCSLDASTRTLSRKFYHRTSRTLEPSVATHLCQGNLGPGLGAGALLEARDAAHGSPLVTHNLTPLSELGNTVGWTSSSWNNWLFCSWMMSILIHEFLFHNICINKFIPVSYTHLGT